MKKKYLYNLWSRLFGMMNNLFPMILLGIIAGGLLFSCEENQEIVITNGEPIALSASENTLVLAQKESNNEVLKLEWTRGSNQGTGASISYQLEIDASGNQFTQSVLSDESKGNYSKSFTVAELNDLLLNTWGLSPEMPATLQARVIATVANESVLPDTSDIINVNITPFDPVTSTLYIFGDASPNGWDVANAVALEMDSKDPTIFVFNGNLSAGEFKFITTQGSFLPSYNKGASDADLVFRTEDAQADDKFVISEAAKYIITVDLIELSISIVKQEGPAYEQMFMVGDATPNGWDIANATEMTQNPNNLFQFTYDGILTPGDFKFPVNLNADWSQDFFMKDPADASKIYLHNGGDDDDSKWTIDKENYYHVVLDIDKYTITIEPFKLYMVGSAGPSGWDVGNSTELVQDDTYWYIFRYEGPLVEGEFKFPVNRNSDWGQDMYMKDPSDPTKMYLHNGGDGDDEKWSISAAEAGDYIITLNIQDLTIDIQKQ